MPFEAPFQTLTNLLQCLEKLNTHVRPRRITSSAVTGHPSAVDGNAFAWRSPAVELEPRIDAHLSYVYSPVSICASQPCCLWPLSQSISMTSFSLAGRLAVDDSRNEPAASSSSSWVSPALGRALFRGRGLTSVRSRLILKAAASFSCASSSILVSRPTYGERIP